IFAFDSMNGSNTWNGPIILNGDSGISVDIDNSYLHVPTTVSGPGGLIKYGPGTLQFFGFSANTYGGRTVVSDGIIEAARVNLIAIPGDAIVGDVGLPPSGGPYSVGLRILRERQISRNANVTLGANGFFW